MTSRPGAVLALLLFASAPVGAAAEGIDPRASDLARQLLRGLPASSGLVLTSFSGSSDPESLAFQKDLARALAAAGAQVIDRSALEAALRGAHLTGDASAVPEVVAAMGARAMVVGSIERRGEGGRAEARVVAAPTGEVLASASVAFGKASVGVEARTLDAQLRRLADGLARGLGDLPGDLRYRHVAVLPFDSVGPRATDQRLGVVVSSEVATALRRDHGVLLVERGRLAALLDEMALGQTGLVDPAKAAEVGKLLGAESLVIGTVADAGDRYLVDARVVSASDGRVHVAESQPLPAADLVALSSDAVVLRSRSGAVFRSVLLPGWGQFYNRQPIKGATFVGAEVAAAGLALTWQVLANRADSDYRAMRTGDFAAASAKVTDRLAWRNGFLWALLAVHVLNIADAAINGQSFDSPGALGSGSSFGLTF
jgi:TolB-like protein